ncbi:uncharacterized protein LOC123664943 [Melitaea cinxia]|uniref:uncharacterized protein LOC123664943 n=1 Tax=Melitaea cinxia TaxID=113334 RepID=UPI001E27301B|nr:uncharacterized protein LOC123664943 [Melitaea cinxia]
MDSDTTSLVLDRAFSILIEDQPYCALRYRRLCQGKGHHVACQFPSPEPGLFCQNYSHINFTNDLKYYVVHYINRRRQRIAAGNERVRGGARLPKPQIMMLVTWDRELAQLAQRLADQCQFVHDDCRATVRYPYAGQSVGEVRWRRSSDSDELSAQRAIRRVLDAWWGERRRVTPQQLTAPFRLTAKGTIWGHFSQLAVWNLRAIGCGAVRHGSEYTRMLLVCDFSHTNMLGQRTITPGPLIACPMHTIRRPRTAYPLLCAPVKRPKENLDHEQLHDYEDQEYEIDDSNDENHISKTEVQETTKTRRITKTTEETTTTCRHLKATSLEGRDKSIMTVNPRIDYFVSLDKESTRRVIDRLQYELEINNNEKEQLTMKKYHQWVSRRPNFGRLREKQEQIWEHNAQNNFFAHDGDQTDHEYNKIFMTKKDHISTLLQETNLRQKWKKTRKRPQRPGVNALLNRPPEKQLKRLSLSSLNLDQDDLDQLFRDTGFNVNWRKESSSQ